MSTNLSDYAVNNLALYSNHIFLYAAVFLSLIPTNATIIESEGFVEFKVEVLTPDVNTPLPLEIFIDVIRVSELQVSG